MCGLATDAISRVEIGRAVDSEIASLTQGAGTTLVALMATDAWQLARDRLTELWRRVQPGRADAVSAELETSREDVQTAFAADDEETLGELRAQWQGRFRRLLVAHPEVAAELRSVLDELSPPGAPSTPTLTQHATASGHARVYQAGRDQHITDR